jgi:hypothetical protein
MARTQERAVELELTRVPGDRRLYALEGVGTLRVHGFMGRRATAASADGTISIDRRGFWRRELVAVDELGSQVAEFEPRTIRRGGTLRFAGRELTLSPASSWRERYELAYAGRALAILDGKGWGRRPVSVTLLDPEPLDPRLLLFAAFVVRGLAEDASGSSGAGASTAAVC